MSIVPPLGNTRWVPSTDTSSVAGEVVSLHVGRLFAPFGDIPVVYFHDLGHDPATILTGAFDGFLSAITSTSYPVLVPRLGGTSQWANPAVVDASGWVDDLLSWADSAPAVDTRADKVALVGIGMGSLNALNWAWRNPGKVLAVALVGPIVDADAYYDDNPSLQATINASWGSGAAWTAALPTIDPMQNLDLIRPFGHRIGLWYGDADTTIDGADVQAFAELVGATATEYSGTATDRHLAPSGPIASFLLGTLRNKLHAYVGWNDRDWDRFREVALTVEPSDLNTNARRTAVAVGGRRGEFHRLAGDNGNERHAQLLTEISAPDTHVGNIWYQNNGGLMVGQHGNIHRALIDDVDGTYLLYMMWGDIFGVSPWIVNRGVWSGHFDDDDLVLLGNTNSTIPGLRLSAGGEVLASQRIGGTVTLVVHEADLDRNLRSRTLDVEISGPLGDHVIVGAERVDANHLEYPQAGADILNGGAGSWADFGACYPFQADSTLVGIGTATTMRGRCYPLGMAPPAYTDPDWGFTWLDSGGWGPTGYGYSGQLYAHVGRFAVPTDAPELIQTGPLIIDEL